MPLLASPTTVDLLEADRQRRLWNGQSRRLHGARLVTNASYRRVGRANQILVGPTDPPVDWSEIQAQAEPALHALGIRFRRVMLFGEEVRRRLGGVLSAEGFRESLLWLLSFRGIVTTQASEQVQIRRVDPFLRPSWFTLTYRLQQERDEGDELAADATSLYSRLADQPGRTIFAGFRGDTMAGTADLDRIGSLASIEHVQTAPEWRGQGVATALVLRLTDEAVRDGARGIQLVTHSRALADQLYRPCGFETVDVISIFERPMFE